MFEPLTGADQHDGRFPGSGGGANWGGAAFDPTNGYYIINTFDLGQMQSLVPNPDRSLALSHEPAVWPVLGGQGRLMCQKPPWGKLVAVDVNKGTIAWESVLGVTDSLPEGCRRPAGPAWAARSSPPAA
jgi:quinoprotein glucose dehydrogenase